MSRTIKFRAWDGDKLIGFGDLMCRQGHFDAFINTIAETTAANNPNGPKYNLMQYTGLKDKNGDKEVYECDIIDSEGNIIGNQYETPALHEDKANLLIQGFGTKNWFTTYKEAVDRGCHDA